MLRKKATCSLLSLALLIATLPTTALAQTPARLSLASSGESSGSAPRQSRPDLRTTFAEIKTQAKAGTSVEANMKRLGTEWLNPKPQAGYTKKQKILVFSIVAGLIVLAVVLALTTKKGGHTFCSDDPTDPDCLPG